MANPTRFAIANSGISDYAIIGDTRSTALVSSAGSIDWLCWPKPDDPAIFVKLLDDEKGGFCAIELDALASHERRYLPETNILETTFRSATGEVVLIDFMPVRPLDVVPAEGPDGQVEGRLVRILRCVRGTVTGPFVVRPTPNYARES